MVVVSVALKVGIADLDINAQARLLLMLGAGVSAYLISFFLLASILLDAPLAAYIAQFNDRLPRWAKPIARYLLRNRKK
jgi:hypothetical protein